MSEVSEAELRAARAAVRETWEVVARMIKPILEEMKPAALSQAKIDNALIVEMFGPAPVIVALEAKAEAVAEE